MLFVRKHGPRSRYKSSISSILVNITGKDTVLVFSPGHVSQNELIQRMQLIIRLIIRLSDRFKPVVVENNNSAPLKNIFK